MTHALASKLFVIWHDLQDPEESMYHVWIIELRSVYHFICIIFIMLIVRFFNPPMYWPIKCHFLYHYDKIRPKKHDPIIPYSRPGWRFHSTVNLPTGGIFIVYTAKRYKTVVSACQSCGLIRAYHWHKKEIKPDPRAHDAMITYLQRRNHFVLTS